MIVCLKIYKKNFSKFGLTRFDVFVFFLWAGFKTYTTIRPYNLLQKNRSNLIWFNVDEWNSFFTFPLFKIEIDVNRFCSIRSKIERDEWWREREKYSI